MASVRVIRLCVRRCVVGAILFELVKGEMGERMFFCHSNRIDSEGEMRLTNREGIASVR